RACLVVAAPPLGLHPLHEEPLHPHAEQWLPSREQWRHSHLQLLSIPFLYESLSLVLTCSRSHSQKHAAVLQFDRGWLVALADRQQIALPPHVVAFPVHVLARCLALLFPQ